MSFMNLRLLNDFSVSAKNFKLSKTCKVTRELTNLPAASRFTFQYVDLLTVPSRPVLFQTLLYRLCYSSVCIPFPTCSSTFFSVCPAPPPPSRLSIWVAIPSSQARFIHSSLCSKCALCIVLIGHLPYYIEIFHL